MHSIRHSRDVRLECILLMLLLTGQSVRFAIDRASGFSNLSSIASQIEWNSSQELAFANWSESKTQLSQQGSLLHLQAASSLRSHQPKPSFTGDWKLTDTGDTNQAFSFVHACTGIKGAVMAKSLHFGLNVNIAHIEHDDSYSISFRTYIVPVPTLFSGMLGGCVPKPPKVPFQLSIAMDVHSIPDVWQKTYDPQGKVQDVQLYWDGDALMQQGWLKGDVLLTKWELLDSGTMAMTNTYKEQAWTAHWSQEPGCYGKKCPYKMDGEQW